MLTEYHNKEVDKHMRQIFVSYEPNVNRLNNAILQKEEKK